jgi:nucleoside-triphosphatase
MTQSSPLQSLLEKVFTSPAQPQLIIITGDIGIGKSTYCNQVIAASRAMGKRVAGIQSPGVFLHGNKIGFDLLDLASGERRRLATRRRGSESADLSTPRWLFDSSVVDWGNQVLADLPPHDLLVIDELGPLEFNRGQGFTVGMARLDSSMWEAACIVVRQMLLAEARLRWPFAAVHTIIIGTPGGQGE